MPGVDNLADWDLGTLRIFLGNARIAPLKWAGRVGNPQDLTKFSRNSTG